MLRKGIVFVSTILALAGSVACSSSTTNPPPSNNDTKQDGGGGGGATGAKAKPKSAPKTASLKSRAGSTPPQGAKPQGAKTSPKVGAITVPIQEVEVYLFVLDYDGNGTDDDINWAHVDGTTYLWATGAVTCADGTVDPAGAFLMEVKADGTGTYMFSLGGCPTSDLFGCDFDENGDETTCGACEVQGEDVVCVVAE